MWLFIKSAQERVWRGRKPCAQASDECLSLIWETLRVTAFNVAHCPHCHPQGNSFQCGLESLALVPAGGIKCGPIQAWTNRIWLSWKVQGSDRKAMKVLCGHIGTLWEAMHYYKVRGPVKTKLERSLVDTLVDTSKLPAKGQQLLSGMCVCHSGRHASSDNQLTLGCKCRRLLQQGPPSWASTNSPQPQPTNKTVAFSHGGQ
jgi:hypothetical protein